MKVSVAIITYRHERYIGEALDGVLAQRGVDSLEVLVSDDCSPDGTRAVVESYIRRHPDLIRLRPIERNLGVGRNIVETLRACRGEYIAFLEGDDYWTRPDKLARQLALLEARPDASFCYHRVNAVADDDRRVLYELPGPQRRQAEIEARDLTQENPVSLSSVMMRRSMLPDFDETAYAQKILDWPLLLLLASRGKGLYLDELMGCYRWHATSVHTSLSPEGRMRDCGAGLKWVLPRVPESIRSDLAETVARHHYARMGELERLGRLPEARAELWNCSRTHFQAGQWWRPHLLRSFVRLNLPFLRLRKSRGKAGG